MRKAKSNGKTNPEPEYFHIGDVCVDTGMLVMADPCRIDEVMSALADNQADTLCIRDKYKLGIGVTAHTGLGDGIYPVVAQYETTPQFGRRIACLHIDFTNPIRNKGCQKDFPHEMDFGCYRGDWDDPSDGIQYLHRPPTMLDTEASVLRAVTSHDKTAG